jgi:membrane protease YdiL (CAAX protease family)
MKKYFKMILFILAYILMPLIIDFSIIALIKDTEIIKSISNDTPTIFFGIFDVISTIALFGFVKFVRRENPIKFAGFKKISIITAIVCIFAGFMMASTSYAIINLDYFKTNIPQIGDSIAWLVSGNVLLLLYIVAVNSLYKEFCFRGLAFNELRNNIPVTAALVLQAMFYALEIYFQMDICSTIYALVGQLLFGLIYFLGKSIWASILAQLGCTLGLLLISRTVLVDLFTNSSAILLIPLTLVLLGIAIIFLSKNYKNNNKAIIYTVDKLGGLEQ